MADRQAAFAPMTAFLEFAFRLLTSFCGVRSRMDRPFPADAVLGPGSPGWLRSAPGGHAPRPRAALSLRMKFERRIRISKRRKAMGGAAPG